MNNLMNNILKDSLVASQATSTNTSTDTNYENIWKMVSGVEFIIIIMLIFIVKYNKRNTLKEKIKKEVISESVDYNNIFTSSFHSHELYDKLKVKCHPDKFPTDLALNKIAEELFQEINKNKTNYKRLEELKIEAIKKLNINI